MMEPSSKKRKIMPRPAEKPSQLEQQSYDEYKNNALPVPEAAPQSERSDFEDFARHLQDAAILIYSKANRSPYKSVSVLLLRWEDDLGVEPDLLQLEKVFREHFNYRTETWCIPSCPNPSIKLTIQIARHLEHARADHLRIVYYAGYGFIGSDQNLYWACNSREDSSKLKWEGVRCLLEDSQTDILLLLDTCAVAEPGTGNHGIKQVIAAYQPDHAARDPGPRSFTSNLTEALNRLGGGRPFTIQRLHEEIVSLKQNTFLQHAGLANGATKPSSGHQRSPVCFSLTPGRLKSIMLAPVDQQEPSPVLASRTASPEDDAQAARFQQDQAQLMKFTSSIDLTFEEPRALVCTTFLGEPSPEMSSFRQWLQHTPVDAGKISVEGMFHGPPTVLLISMPIAVWNILSADRVCAFLGYVNSHNMTSEYQRLTSAFSPIPKAATFRELEDGKILLEARQAAASTPIMHRHDSIRPDLMLESACQDNMRTDPMILNTPSSVAPAYPESGPSSLVGQKHEVEDSVEMHEAAEQLKALSHVRHLSHDHATGERNHSHVASENSPGMRSPHGHSASSPEPESHVDDGLYHSAFNSPATRPKARRTMPKSGPKQDTRCSLCSHAPFKDSSSLRKHIAAAHTRPFPCAFSFAGCTSTFGSKNEWKRHIASQHLCLTYYRCSRCVQSTVEGKGNEFNRKDLFTQHLRRMHAPFGIKKAIAKAESKLQLEWETHVKEMQASCLVIRRQPPQRSACPKAECSTVFEGMGSWDDWTEHVGRHMEKGEAGRLGVDQLLAQWALDEGIIERKSENEYRLVGSERDGAMSAGYYSDGNSVKRDGVADVNGTSQREGDNMLYEG